MKFQAWIGNASPELLPETIGVAAVTRPAETSGMTNSMGQIYLTAARESLGCIVMNPPV